MNIQDVPPSDLARYYMIEQQIRPWNVLEPRLLQVLAEVKREDFVQPAHKTLAFGDVELPISASQFMLSPKVQARMVHDLGLTGAERVLQIGAGTGYMTALLARLAKHVTALEMDSSLAQTAADNLRQAVVVNADVVVADGSSADAVHSEFDAMVLCGSVAQLPQALLEKLCVGGAMVAIVGNAPIMRFTKVVRTSTGLQTQAAWDTVAPRLIGFGETPAFSF